MASLGHNELKNLVIIGLGKGLIHDGTKPLTKCGVVMPYSYINMGQHWLRQWLIIWQHQAITWTSVDWSSVRSCGIHLMAISQEILRIFILDMSLKIIMSVLQLHLPGPNELTWTNVDLFFVKSYTAHPNESQHFHSIVLYTNNWNAFEDYILKMKIISPKGLVYQQISLLSLLKTLMSLRQKNGTWGLIQYKDAILHV